MKAKTAAKAKVVKTHAPRWAVGMEKLAPGIYVRGIELHISEEEICEYSGVPCTEENQAAARRVVLEVLRELWPAIPVTVLTDEAGL